MVSIDFGNLNQKIQEAPSRRGWFLGHFIDTDSIYSSDQLELKWGVHLKGEQYNTEKANSIARSVAILIKGKVRINFPDQNQEIRLVNQGDFVIWEAGVYHTYEMLEDTTILTIRWPSVENDVMIR